jgi:hypothetical protein
VRKSMRQRGVEAPFLNLFSAARAGPPGSMRFSPVQVEQIRRTVGRTPEVMVKVTGGGTRRSAVAAHVAYISHKGELEIETDDGEHVDREAQCSLLKDWHLELSPGQYRQSKEGEPAPRTLKLTHNIVLSMPKPTPPAKVLAAAKVFAREKFALQHRYALVLHTHQENPHVHLVVKAEGLDGRRLHIDKPMLRAWREDFAALLRAEGVAANATPRVVRGRNQSNTKTAVYRIKPSRSHALRQRVEHVARELSQTGTITDPARATLLETRKAVLSGWEGVAAALDAQGEILLAGDVRYFAKRLPAVQTDRERLAEDFKRHLAAPAAMPNRARAAVPGPRAR